MSISDSYDSDSLAIFRHLSGIGIKNELFSDSQFLISITESQFMIPDFEELTEL